MWCHRLLPVVVLALASIAGAGDLAGLGWRRVQCIASDQLDVTLLVRDATPAVPLFLGFELHNKTNAPLRVDHAGYRLVESFVEPLDGGPRLSSRAVDFLRGNTYDLFWREGPRPPELGPRETTIPPGVTRRLAYPSGYAHYSLDHYGLIGLRVGGRAVIDISLENGPRLTTPQEGVAFSFDYLPPDDDGIASMRLELDALLAAAPEGIDDVVYAHHLRRMLGRPEVAEAAGVNELLAALNPQQVDYAARGVIVAHLNEHYPSDKRMVDRYARGLADRETSDWLRDLADEASAVADPALIEPLVARAEDPLYWSDVGLALKVLSRHRAIADDPQTLSRRLGRIAAGGAPADFLDGTTWDQTTAEELVYAGDPANAELLTPFLEDPTPLYSIRDIALRSGPGNTLPMRVKDKAANAVLDLLGDEHTPRASVHMAVEDEAAELVRRDEVARRLLKHLNARGQ